MAEVASPALSADDRTGVPRAGADAVLTVFGALWAVASLFHVLGPSGRAGGLVDDVTAVGVGHALVALAAIAVLLLPGRTVPLAVLAMLGPVTAWQESPILGNHWLVMALVDLGLLLALLATRGDRVRTAEGFLPTARWVLVAFYSFAAFAKLNHGFFDTRVSCATVYLDETARTLGLPTPLAVGDHRWAVIVPVATVAIELSVPVLLLVRRTRWIGVAVGIVFHSAIAIDQEHLFSDFTSTLLALFTLFLPFAFAASAADLLRRGRAVVAGWALLAFATSAAQWSGRAGLLGSTFVDGRLWLWVAADLAVVVVVGRWLLADRATPSLARPLAYGPRSRWLAIVPVLAVLNGIAPYLELKTAFSYTMYANLTTVGGDTNHLLVPRTFPVAGRLDGLVRIEATDDPGLRPYLGAYLLPWDSLRTYLAGHPDSSITYERDGERHELAHARDEPALVSSAPLLAQKLAPLRAVALADPPPCQEVFLPAL